MSTRDGGVTASAATTAAGSNTQGDASDLAQLPDETHDESAAEADAATTSGQAPSGSEGHPDATTGDTSGGTGGTSNETTGPDAGVDALLVGQACIPRDEYRTDFTHLQVSEVSVGPSAQCGAGVCLVNHFQGRTGCPYGQEPPDVSLPALGVGKVVR